MFKVNKVKLYRRGSLMREIENFIMRLTINFINEEVRLELMPSFENQSGIASTIRSIHDKLVDKIRLIKRSINQDGGYVMKKTNVKWKNTVSKINNIFARVQEIGRSLRWDDGYPKSGKELLTASSDAEFALKDLLDDEVDKLTERLDWDEVKPARLRNFPVFDDIDVPGGGKIVLTPTNQPTTKPGGLGG